MTEEIPLFEKFRLYFVQSAAALAGIVLFAIGLSGRMEAPLYPVAELSFLAQPMPVSDAVNHYYWTLLLLVGVWLMLCMAVRWAAVVALGLIGFKWAVLQGYFVNLLAALPKGA